jgi:hypothetical protein
MKKRIFAVVAGVVLCAAAFVCYEAFAENKPVPDEPEPAIPCSPVGDGCWYTVEKKNGDQELHYAAGWYR